MTIIYCIITLLVVYYLALWGRVFKILIIFMSKLSPKWMYN